VANTRIEDSAEGYVAKVDSGGRLHVKSDCSGREVTTTRGVFTDSGVATLSSALENCCHTMVHNFGNNPLRIGFDDDPVSGDYEVAANSSFVLPFPFSGVLKGIGVGGGGTFVTLQAKQSS
jgi:hypothetical protein